MMVMYAERPLDNVAYNALPKEGGGWDVAHWFGQKPPLQARNPLMNLPYVEADGVLVTQSNACFTFLGRKLNMLGNGEADLIACEQLLCELMDLRNKIVGFVYGPKGTDAEETAGLFKQLEGILSKLNAALAANTSKGHPACFFVGNSATAPDFHGWELLDQLSVYAARHNLPNPVAPHTALATFHREFMALPKNAKYLASPMHALPCNNLMASLGSAPGPTHGEFKGEEPTWQANVSGKF